MCKFLCGHQLQFLWVNIKECNCQIVWYEYVQFSKKPPNAHANWLYYFAFPLAMNERSCCFTSSKASGVDSVLHFDSV